ncbi:MAG TPA: transglutaminase family protein [Candidatus Competibacteraceae bacterium]|nr:MAG: transglutaminase family protein [Candidatus Competibacteraceae bacterium]HOB62607.1 transglutaminase family protein [Candidatus Competibacteraceae bacterium]HQA26468.1 transglutaminase family protein [Candidatus Competibacteraceae bacterium]HQD57451.1 transglutaminase family protein [Candidatus Competibacteraceae bacterium]
MAIRVALHHQTSYHFDHPVGVAPHVIRLRPASHARTPVHAYSLKIEPAQHFINWMQDPFGNFQARLVFPEKVRELSITVDLIAEMTVINPFDFFVESYAEHYPFSYEGILRQELAPYLEIQESGPLLLDWLTSVNRDKTRIVDFLVALNSRLSHDIGYVIRMEPGVQTSEETLTKRTGSCRDSAWLLVQILRHLGLAARFVSGYLIQLTADVKSLDGPSGTEVDFTDLHAWAEVFVPGAGWLGLDPTSGLFAGEGHIPLACTPTPPSAAPVTGFTEPCEVEFGFDMRVTRIHEDPRVTKPYTEEQWRTIEALGHAVDEKLRLGDVRLTMGGEPTFVSIDDMDGAEWTVAASGPTKRKLAGRLLKKLRDRFAPNGFLHYTQGKWYPGESLPRWALSCYWRTDRAPLWHDPRWIADDENPQGYGPEQALAFATELTQRLGVKADRIIPGYEDVYYYLWKERTLPVNVDPLKYNLKDEEERRRLAILLERGLNQVTGYALPLRWDYATNSWCSGPWVLRRDHLYLIPGDSPMGYRLPLSALPWVSETEWEIPHPQSLFEFRSALGDAHGEVMRRYSKFVKGGMDGAPQGEEQADVARRKPQDDSTPIHTSLCVESREGHLYVFMPPLGQLEHYLDVLACVEQTASALQMPVLVEGYAPPSDWRLRKLAVTPDPGVIEVNIHPAGDWDELRFNIEGLYEDARQSRLGTEKFMLDGRHTGTGGGNHVTLGGATPSDSPFLRRPELLRSLLTYWQHHPSLSTLFSGLFIGPTSQAPRVDEARNDSLYELEIAFQQMPPGEVPQPWLVDRLLRNLLVDLSGNTHRAEFCIDKLYSPDSSMGRLGLLEMRAFEMPPHARMSLMQMLLLRGLVARFWDQPYQNRELVRWGTRIHDDFMLPHYVWRDFQDVISDLRQTGYPFESDWFLPFFEFRFPHYGDIVQQDIQLELRQALEPWHVLGEEQVQGGTARYVDSSVERMQVKVRGMVGERHVIACNGRRMPLRATGIPGEYVAGVRYRAWQPPSALHPTIPVHAPLVFDVVDTWNQHSIGGCTYHVSHPGGRNYDSFPVNANEAEARRFARFWPYGHTPGSMVAPDEETNPNFPCTLDLRRRDE